MTTKISVVKFTFRKEWRALNDALSGKYDSESFSTSADLIGYLSSQPVSLVFASLSEKDDLIQLATFVKMVKKGAKDTILKIVVVNFSGNKQFEKAIGKLGILDVVDPNINTKALRFKIDFYMKSLNGQVKNSNKAAMNLKSIEQAKAQEQKKTDAANWLAPMDLEDDIWILKKDSDCKKVLGRWLVRFTGPGPAVCQWTEVRGKANAWKLEFKEGFKDTFLTGTGTWYFQGDQKPEFVWKENSWLITGSSFELFYHVNGAKNTRAKLKDKVLELCKNSEYALTKEPAIIESFDKELVFKKEADNLGGSEEVEGEKTDWLNNLEGKGSTDHLDHSHLEGENDPSADQLNTDPMSMDLEPGDNNLGNGNMSGKGGGQDDLGGNYEGESSTDKLDHRGKEGAAGVRAAESPELGLENKNQDHKTKYKGHNAAEEFDAKDDLLSHSATKHREGSELGMKNTHAEHKTHYKGHNEAEEFEANDEKSNNYREEDLGGHNGGKSSTDKIPKFYNKDGSKPNRPLTPEEQKESDAYEGKSSTDKLASHYGRSSDHAESSANKENDSQKAERKRSSKAHADEPDFEDDDGQDAYGGKSSTDKLNSHYGRNSKTALSSLSEDDLFDDAEDASDETPEKARKERAARLRKEREDSDSDFEEKPSKDFSGSSGTDKIESHYGRGKKSGQKLSEDDLFEDEEDDFSESDDSENSSPSALDERRAARKKYKESLVEEDIFETNKSKHHDEADESSDEDDFSEKKSKRRRSTSEDEGAEVISIGRAREKRPKPAPLVPESEIDSDLKTLTEEATITVRVKQKELEVICSLDDYFEKTIILISQKTGFNSHDPVKLDLKFRYMQKVTNLSFDATMTSIDFVDELTCYLTVELSDANAEAFSSFMSLYQQRQENIELFLKRAKGL